MLKTHLIMSTHHHQTVVRELLDHAEQHVHRIHQTSRALHAVADLTRRQRMTEDSATMAHRDDLAALMDVLAESIDAPVTRLTSNLASCRQQA